MPAVQAQQINKIPDQWKGYLDTLSNKGNKRTPNSRLLHEQFYLLQTSSPEKLQALAAKGLVVSRQLDEQHFIVTIREKYDLLDKEPNYTFYAVNWQWKLSPRLQKQLLKKHESQQQAFVLKGSSGDDIQQKIQQAGIEVQLLDQHISSHTYLISCTYSTLVKEFLPLPSLLYADIRATTPQEESRLLDANLSVNGINVLHHEYPQFRGQGELISIKEQKYSLDDLDLLGLNVLTGQEGATASRHATDMATIIAGSASTSPRSAGVAPSARITSSDFLRLLPDPDAYFQQNEIYLQNHSYGTAIENFYGAEAAAYDASTLQNPRVLHVFSSGNSGSVTPDAGPYEGISGYANLTGNYKQAKNILTVGAVDTLKQLDPFVSRGPAYDGRIKPELVAYSSLGSSSAAALVTGTAALLQQAYQSLHGGIVPPAELLKAILLNTAEDVGPAQVDYLSGFGNLQAHKAMESIQQELYIRGEIEQNEVRTMLIELPENARNLKITLVWHDAPAAVNSTKALVNDLDLQLQHAASSSSWLPWVLNPYPHPDSLALPAKRGIDRLNNVEQITVENPEEGPYQVLISAYDVSQGPQSFSLAYSWELADTFTWLYPTGSDNMPMHGEQSSIFRWNETYDVENGTLEYRLNGGEWQLISEAVALDKEYLQWAAPEVTAIAQARMSINGAVYLSDPFVLSPQLSTTVGFNCTDSLMLSWNQLEGVVGYEVYALGSQQLEPIVLTTDTMLVLNKQEYPQVYYSVAPVLENQKRGPRSTTFDYRLQGVECYLSSFLVYQEQEAIALSLVIGTVYQVERIVFEKKQNQAFIPINTRSTVSETAIVYLDEDPANGWNTYRAHLYLANGEELLTEAIAIFYLKDTPVVVFPNPLQQPAALSVYLKELPQQGQPLFQLYGPKGQFIWEQELFNERESLLLPPLPAGLYLYKVSSQEFSESGKLIIY